MNVNTYLKFALRPRIKDTLQIEDLWDPYIMLNLPGFKPMPVSIAILFLAQDPTFVMEFMAHGNSMPMFYKIREEILRITEEPVLWKYNLSKPDAEDLMENQVNISSNPNKITATRTKRRKLKTNKTRRKPMEWRKQRRKTNIERPKTLCRHSRSRLKRSKTIVDRDITLYTLRIYDKIIIFHTNYLFMKNNNNQIYKHMDPLYQRTYGTLYERYKDTKLQNINELKNSDDQLKAILIEQKIREDNLNKLKDRYIDYLTKSYKAICWKCGQLAHTDSKTCTKKCKYCAGNHVSNECLIKFRCGWCGQMAGEHKCLEDVSSSLLQIRCPLCRFRGHPSNKCTPLFQCLRSMYSGIKKILKKNKTNFTGIRRRRFGINYRRNGRNRRRRLKRLRY